jgi:glycyl-tRNA synthetase
LPLGVAPTKALIVPLCNQPQFAPLVGKISARLRSLGISNNVDSSTAPIGKRYARNDELGTPLGITINFDAVKDGSIALRERDTMVQVLGPEDDAIRAVEHFVSGAETWERITQRMPLFLGQGRDD